MSCVYHCYSSHTAKKSKNLYAVMNKCVVLNVQLWRRPSFDLARPIAENTIASIQPPAATRRLASLFIIIKFHPIGLITEYSALRLVHLGP